MFLALYGPNWSDEKNGYFGGRGNLEKKIWSYGYRSSDGNIFLDLFSIKHNLRQF